MKKSNYTYLGNYGTDLAPTRIAGRRYGIGKGGIPIDYAVENYTYTKDVFDCHTGPCTEINGLTRGYSDYRKHC